MASISTHASLTTSLVSYWKMDEASGTREDIHGPNDLTANGTGGVGSATGKINSAADFELSDSDYLSIADASQTGLDFSGDMSASFWLNIESAPASGEDFTVFSKGSGADGAYALTYSNVGGTPKLNFWIFDSGNPSENINMLVNQTFSTATWYHVVVTFTASTDTAEFFVNGSSLGTASNSLYSGTTNNSALPFNIGRYQAGNRYFDGLIDELGMWSKVLSGSEITDLYNSSNGLPYSETTSATTTARKHTLALMGVG